MSFVAPPADRFSTFQVVAAIAAVLIAPFALASDGSLEIHQACVATGCFPGDSPGFPVEIVTSGSYVLTSNLQVPDENTTAIDLDGDNIHIDLGGFTISGVTDCGLNTGTACSPAATNAAGILGGLSRDSSVTNGSVRGMGGFGINLGDYSRIQNLHTSHNGFDGITISGGGIVQNSVSRRNGRFGINMSGEAVVTGSIANRNNRDGIEAGGRGTFRDNVSSLNGEVGLRIGGASVAIGNSLNNNFGAGLDGGASSGYSQNTLFSNADDSAGAQVTGSIVQLGPNVCAGVPCP